jgi:hypothetical protein
LPKVNIVMMRAGALVVAGVAPREAERAVIGRQFVHLALQAKMVRAVRVRMRFRNVRVNENPTHWLADRDFGISLLLLEGLSDDELESCYGCAGNCLALEEGRLVVLWVPRVTLPLSMQSDVDVEVFLAACGEVLGDAVSAVLASLQEITISPQKKRKVNSVMNLTACAARARAARARALYTGARWNVLLGYLRVAGLCEQQFQNVQNMLIDTSVRTLT